MCVRADQYKCVRACVFVLVCVWLTFVDVHESIAVFPCFPVLRKGSSL
jgi:hypothetical protein